MQRRSAAENARSAAENAFATHLVATTQPGSLATTSSAEAVAQFALTGKRAVAETATTGMQPLPDAALKP